MRSHTQASVIARFLCREEEKWHTVPFLSSLGNLQLFHYIKL